MIISKGDYYMGFKNMTVNVDEEIIKDLKQIAFDEDCSLKKIINEMLRDGIQRKKGQSRLDED